MNEIFSDRINDVPRSFLREILKIAISDDVISFAGGLPNRQLFPAPEIRAAANTVLEHDAGSALQYGSSEGYLPLREYICERYRTTRGIEIEPGNVLVTTGSQQGLDLLGKVLLNDGDSIAIEEPGYLGAIQAFSVYRAKFEPVPVGENGADIEALRNLLNTARPKLFYTVPTFQNPSGISYTNENREEVAASLRGTQTILIEDDPYHELRFSGSPKTSFKQLLPKQTVMLGSFSKIVAPSFRVGWMVAGKPLMEKLVIAKQAADLHTSEITQRILYRYLSDNDIDEHIALIRRQYGAQCDAMLQALESNFPPNCRITHPEGGMFLWMTLPNGLSAMSLFKYAIEKKVAFVPGDPFYVDGRQSDSLRLNFSCVDETSIRTGIERLASSYSALAAHI